MDTRSGLMWAAKDNGSTISWQDAKSYCENYRGGGYTDWRMPTHVELERLYDKAKIYRSACGGDDVHLTKLINLTCKVVWGSENFDSEVAIFNFTIGALHLPRRFYDSPRALPVRSAK